MSNFERFLALLSRGLMIVGGVCIVLMMLQVSADILAKYVLNVPIQGTLEIVSYWYMVAVVFLPLAAVERDRGHIFVEVFTQHLSPRRVAMVDAFAGSVGVVYVAILTWMTGVEAVRQTAVLEVWDAIFFEIPVWPTRWFLPLGCGVLALYLLLHVLADIVFAASGRRVLGVKPSHDPARIDE